MRSFPRTWALGFLALLFACAAESAVRLDTYAANVHEFTLANGLRVVLIEDHSAPIVTAAFTARGGYADDPKGMRGMASLAAYLLDEGPATLGSRNPASEPAAVKALLAAVAGVRAVSNKPGTGGALDRMDAESKLRLASGQLESLTKPRFNTRSLENYGVLDFQISTLADTIQWSARLPSNRIDAFLLLYGEWLKRPFPRLVYTHRDRIIREQTDTPTTQDFIIRRALLSPVFGAQGYGLPPVDTTELATVHYPDVDSFLQSRFAASNLTLALSGDLTRAEAQALAARYLDKIPAGQPFTPAAPPAYPAKEVRLAPPGELPGMLGIAYRRPAESSPDDPVFDMIVEILVDNPMSRLRTSFAKANPFLTVPTTFPSLPGARQGGLFAALAGHHPSRTPEEWAVALSGFFEELGKAPPSADEIEFARRSLERKLLLVLSDPARSAGYVSQMGGWKPVAWNKTTAADIQRVAAEYLRPERRLILQPGYVAATPGDAQ
jgi:predicted Zn-dependent peptidase